MRHALGIFVRTFSDANLKAHLHLIPLPKNAVSDALNRGNERGARTTTSQPVTHLDGPPELCGWIAELFALMARRPGRPTVHGRAEPRLLGLFDESPVEPQGHHMGCPSRGFARKIRPVLGIRKCSRGRRRHRGN